MTLRQKLEIGWRDADHSSPRGRNRVDRMPVVGGIRLQPKSKHPQTRSRLLSLPTEIQILIYEALFYVPGDVLVERRWANAGPLSLLQTCRQVLDEAEDIYYSIIRFHYDPNRTGSIIFAKAIGRKRRDAIASMSIMVKSGANAHAILRDLYGLENLRSLHIQRFFSIRFLNLSEWAVMTGQIRHLLAQMPNLQEVKVITPLAKDITPLELQRQPNLNEIDSKPDNVRVAPWNQLDSSKRHLRHE